MNHPNLPRKTGWSELIKLVCGYRKRFRVAGNSMLPLLQADDEVLIAHKSNVSLKAGDIVVAGHPDDKELILIKLVQSITGDGKIELAGLNRDASTDSREFGAVPRSCIWGRVTSIFHTRNENQGRELEK